MRIMDVLAEIKILILASKIASVKTGAFYKYLLSHAYRGCP